MKPQYSRSSLVTIISVYFFWGFVAASNTVLIGLFKKNFELTQTQSQFVDLAFYIAYSVGALIYFAWSSMSGDPLNKIGYKKGLIIGLLISAIGAIGFIPAASAQSFPLMLTSLFTIGLGFALQQIVANPYVIALGDESTGSHRISLAGGLNSFGTTIGPLLLGFAIFGNINSNDDAFVRSDLATDPVTVRIERTTNKTETVSGPVFLQERTIMGTLPYFFLANNKDSAVIISQYSFMEEKKKGSVIIYNDSQNKTDSIVKLLKEKFPKSRIPIITLTKENYIKLLSAVNTPHGATMGIKMLGVEKVRFPSLILAASFILFAVILAVSKLPSVSSTEIMERKMGALSYPQVVLGMIAIFFYVGTEVTIQSNLPELMKQNSILGLENDKTLHFISLYWGCLMIGRWTGALKVFNFSKIANYAMTIIVPFIAYAVILGVNYIKGSPVNDIINFAPFVLILIGGFFISQEKPARTMMLFGVLAMIMMLVGLCSAGKIALYSFISCGLFCSVMWPCIFSLSIAGLGKFTNQASSLLIMMICGGAFIPPLQGYLADKIGIHISYIIPLIGFAYLTFYGWKIKRILQKQGIDYDTSASNSGH